jgi:hypothetical protein
MPTLNGIGGGGNHALLINLDKANSGHTGFAGTDERNTFGHQQKIKSVLSDAPLYLELLTNNDFDTTLTGWTNDGSFSVATGAAVNSSGTGVLTQVITTPNSDLYALEIKITGMTTGWVDVYDDNDLDASADAPDNGIFQDIQYVAAGTDTIYVEVGDGFDGRIEYVSVKEILEGGYPAQIVLYNRYDQRVAEIRATTSGQLYFGLQAGQLSLSQNVGIGNNALGAIIQQYGNVGLGDSAGAQMTANEGLLIGNSAGYSETVNRRLHIGNSGDIISGTMDGGNAPTQALQLHAATIIMAELPTSKLNLAVGQVWNSSNALKVVSLGSELLTNPGMESGTPPSSWTASDATATSDTSYHGGAKALKLVLTDDAGGASQDITVTNGETYRVSVYAKADNGTATLRMYEDTGGFTEVGIASTAATTYTLLTFDFVAGTTDHVVQLLGTTDADEVYFDDASVKLVN